MSISTFERNASVLEMAVEIDRRGAAIEALEARLAATETVLRRMNDLLTKIQNVTTRYLVGLPNGLTQDQYVDAIIGLQDGPEQRAAQAPARAILNLPVG